MIYRKYHAMREHYLEQTNTYIAIMCEMFLKYNYVYLYPQRKAMIHKETKSNMLVNI